MPHASPHAGPPNHAGRRDAVLHALSRYGAMSRAQLGRTIELSRTSVWSTVSELIADGSIVEVAGGASADRPRGGRPANLLALPQASDAVVGIEFARTEIHAILADLSGQVLSERRITVMADEFGLDALPAAADLVDQLVTQAGIAHSVVRQVVLGLATPIRRSPEGVVLGRMRTGWSELLPATEFERWFGKPVWVENNANLGALAESRGGAAAGVDDVVYVKFGRGVGAGLVLNGQVYSGTSGIAGEIGHVLVDEDGEPCWCGSHGCLATVVSGTHITDLLRPGDGTELTLPDVVRLVTAGDPLAHKVIADAGRLLGRALADLCASLNPGAVVIGGELSGCGDVLFNAVDSSLRHYLQPAVYDSLRLVPASLGERTEAAGAVTMALDLARALPVA